MNMPAADLPPGVTVRGPRELLDTSVLSREALGFVADLERRFGAAIEARLAARGERQARLDGGERLDFLAETAALREAPWRCAPPPVEVQDRRVEITGPVERKLIINALNSGAQVFMADFEDATAPTLHNVIDGQHHLRDAVRGEIRVTLDGKVYALGEQTAALFVRPRGLHLPERHILVDGAPAHGCLVDFGLYAVHNARHRHERGLGTYFYLPKLESHREAQLWDAVLVATEERLALPRGTLRATVLIETLPAAFEMHGYATLFDDLDRGFPEITLSLPKSRSLLARSAPAPAPLKVHKVGAFEASFVPSLADFNRLDPRFRMSDAVWRALPQYADWGFCVFKLIDLKRRWFGGADRRTIHPMAFEFPRRDPSRLFFPTVHVHDGAVHEEAAYDHTLYYQAEHALPANLGAWLTQTSPTAAQAFLDVPRSAGIIDGAAPVHRLGITGNQRNTDVLLG